MPGRRDLELLISGIPVPSRRGEGRSRLLVEQYGERAVGVADSVCLLQKGEMVVVGEPSQSESGVVFSCHLGSNR